MGGLHSGLVRTVNINTQASCSLSETGEYPVEKLSPGGIRREFGASKYCVYSGGKVHAQCSVNAAHGAGEGRGFWSAAST